MASRVRTIEWKAGRVIMIDQRLLPTREVYRVYRDHREVAKAIKQMVIRGAPAIGVAAAMGRTSPGSVSAPVEPVGCTTPMAVAWPRSGRTTCPT